LKDPEGPPSQLAYKFWGHFSLAQHVTDQSSLFSVKIQKSSYTMQNAQIMSINTFVCMFDIII
jgi:hypothetical protein